VHVLLYQGADYLFSLPSVSCLYFSPGQHGCKIDLKINNMLRMSMKPEPHHLGGEGSIFYVHFVLNFATMYSFRANTMVLKVLNFSNSYLQPKKKDCHDNLYIGIGTSAASLFRPGLTFFPLAKKNSSTVHKIFTNPMSQNKLGTFTAHFRILSKKLFCIY
jgi:hypothetical protein